MAEPPVETLAALRRARLRRRAEGLDLFEVLYQAYLTALLSSVAVVVTSDLVGDRPVSTGDLAAVRDRGAAGVGVVVALLVFVACRSGAQGGPLALERPDVVHVLLAPVERGRVLRRPALARLRAAGLGGAAVGAGIGVVASHRLPGAAPEWIASGGLAGLTTGTFVAGAALAVSGRRITRPVATAVGAFVVAWPLVDLGLEAEWSPFTSVGALALWPVGPPGPVAATALAVAVVVAASGVARIGGISLEAAERRSALVGQLRFAATVCDLRTVVVLRRQLAQERPRRRPWLRLPPGSGPGTAVWKRDWQSVLRWPPGRIVRSLFLAGAAGVALRAMWAGTTALVIAAGVALWLVALDAVEGLAQDQEHPDLARRFPVRDGRLLARHVPAGVVVMLLVVPAAALGALPGGRAPLVAGLAVAVALPAAASAVAAAAVSTARTVDYEGAVMAALAPEIAGFRLVVRESIPPALATFGLLPLVAAREAAEAGNGPVAAAVASSVLVAIPVAGSVWWLTRRRLA